MANLPISGLPAVVTPLLTDEDAVNQGGLTKKRTTQQIKDNVLPNGPFTQGSVLFADVIGDVAEDNTDFFYNATDKSLKVGDTNAVSVGNGLAIGGNNNTVSGGNANGVCIGGDNNTVTGEAASALGSSNSTASGANSTIVGSDSSTATQQGSVVIGGANNDATGFHSIAMGTRSNVTASGSFAWADNAAGDFTNGTANSFAARATGGVLLQTDSAGVEIGDIPGADQVTIDKTGIALLGTAKREKYVQNGAYDAAGAGGAGSARPHDGVSVWTFAGLGGNQRLNVRDSQFPFDYDSSVLITLEMVYAPSTADVGNAVFMFYYQVNPADDTTVLTGAPNSHQVTLGMSTVAERLATHTSSVFSFIGASNPGDTILFGVERLPGNAADTYLDPVWVTNLRFKYTSKLA
jgi:hypothetical protein